jgi:hypothetical protein
MVYVMGKATRLCRRSRLCVPQLATAPLSFDLIFSLITHPFPKPLVALLHCMPRKYYQIATKLLRGGEVPLQAHLEEPHCQHQETI